MKAVGYHSYDDSDVPARGRRPPRRGWFTVAQGAGIVPRPETRQLISPQKGRQ